ncbi:arginase family protein [Myroides odoratimimus]|uniref:arginase family protein n=1 Tax=Myroides odoratimimus TaxID=76832 RepID=UPI0002F13E05|nr:arginase family protein [Myroides odoratimimus]
MVYIVAKCVSFQVLEKEVIVENKITLKRCALNFESYSIINAFKKVDFTYEEFCSINISTIEEKKSFWSFLLNNQIIVLKYEYNVEPLMRLYNQNYFGLQAQEYKEVRNKICLLGIPYAMGNINSLSIEKGPSYLRTISSRFNLAHLNINLLGQLLGLDKELLESNKEALIDNTMDIGDLFYYLTESPSNYFRKIDKLISHLVENKNTPFSIGGDHSISYPIIKAISDSNDIGVIHFDAHSDTYFSEIDEFYGDITVNHHGNFLTKVLELDRIKQVITLGPRGLKGCQLTGKLNKKHVLFTSFQIQQSNDWLSAIDTDLSYYLTFDVDVFDPNLLAGVSDPISNGLSFNKVIYMLDILFKRLNIVGIDLVEVDPQRDQTGVTGDIVLQLIVHLLTRTVNNKYKN